MIVKRRLKAFVIPALYGIVTVSLLVSLMFLVNSLIKVNNNPLTYYMFDFIHIFIS